MSIQEDKLKEEEAKKMNEIEEEEEEEPKKGGTKFNLSMKGLLFNVEAFNEGEKLSVKNMIFFAVKSSWLLVVIFIFITTGTLNTLLYKFQNESAGKYGHMPPVLFYHPWTQSFQMFIGMTICCLFPHWVKGSIEKIIKWYKKSKQGEVSEEELKAIEEKKANKKPPINQLLFLIPSICDVVASTILSFALVLTYASIYQMLQCITIAFTFLLSITVLKHNFYKFPHKWIGVILVLVGSVLVGLNTVLYPQGEGRATARQPFIGALLVIAACFIYALFYIFEEIFLTGYDTDPLQVPGYEGFWGVTIVMFVLFICYWIPGIDYGRMESFPAVISQMVSNWELALWIILLTCNIGFYNLMGNVITLNISCATRSVLDQVRAFLIWLIQIIRGRQEFTWLQAVGFALMVIGIVIYNEVMFNILIPCYSKWCAKIDEADEATHKGGVDLLLTSLDQC